MKYKVIILFVLVGVTALLFAQERQGEPIILRYADQLVGQRSDTSDIREFIGNVAFQQGIVYVNCDKAKQFLTENRVELTGNVVITQEDAKLRSNKIFYNGNTGFADAWNGVSIQDKNALLTADSGKYSTRSHIAYFSGNVKIVDDSVTIISDYIEYNRKTRESFAKGNVRVEDDSTIIYCNQLEHFRETRDSYSYGNVQIRGKFDNVILTGDTVINHYSRDYTQAKGEPVLFKIDTVFTENLKTKDSSSTEVDTMTSKEISFDTLSIAALLMESIKINDEERFVFTDSVEIASDNLSAKAGKVYYYKTKELIFLENEPILWYDSTQLYADTIIISIVDNKISQILAKNNAIASIRNDTFNPAKINQISGVQLVLLFDDGELYEIVSIDNAKSLLFMSSEDGKSDEGVSRNSADTILIKFIDGEADEFIALSGVFGEFIPESIVLNNISEYYLPTFRWTDIKPRKRKLINRNYSDN